jgi:hypothetical protein
MVVMDITITAAAQKIGIEALDREPTPSGYGL